MTKLTVLTATGVNSDDLFPEANGTYSILRENANEFVVERKSDHLEVRYVRGTGTAFKYDAAGLPTGGTFTSVELIAADKHTVLARMNEFDNAGFLDSIGRPEANQIWTVHFDFTDVLNGGAGNDILHGGNRAVLNGGGGDDTLIYGYDHPLITGFETFSIIDGGTGTDTLELRQVGGDSANPGSVKNIEILKFATTGNSTGDRVYFGLGDLTSNPRLQSNFKVIGDGHPDLIQFVNLFDPVNADFSHWELLNWTSGKVDVGILTGDIVYLYATTDSDQLIGSAGNDLFAGSAGDDTVSGFNGNDLIFGDDDRAGGTGSDILDGGAGNDIIYGGGGADKITGGSGRDIAAYFSEPDSNGNAANIYISLQDQSRNTGEAAGDTFSGIEGLRAGVGSDILIGDSQNNTLQGDFLEFHAGADNLFEHGNDFLDGAAGIDTAIYGQGNGATAVSLAISGPQNTGAWGVDTLISIENLTGSDGVDNFTGNNGVNVLDGGGGNDKLVGLGGADRLLGGAGNDVLIGGSGVDSMAGGSGDDVYYLDDLAERPVELVNSGIDTIVASFDVNLIAMANVEKAVLGGTGGFSATGNALANALSGNTGNNVLSGGLGIDTLRGGAGNDSFQFDTGLNAITNVDKILDFSAPNDTLRLENTGAGLFNTLSLGTLSIDAFQANATGISADATDRIIYNTKTGELFYDLNGNLAGGAIKFAVLTTHPVITHLDFFVV